MLPRPRPLLLTAAFMILLAVVANLAWATAITTTGPWYDAAVSLQVYALSCVLATLLALALVMNASHAAAGLESSLRRIDRRIALLRAKVARRAETNARVDVEVPRGDPALDAMADDLVDRPAGGLVRLEKRGHDTLFPVPATASTSRHDVTAAVLHELLRERVALQAAQAGVWAMAAGPVAACLVFLAIAAPMLPGSGAFAAAHYQLNTTLVLFLSYGLAPLVAWCVLVLGWTLPTKRMPVD